MTQTMVMDRPATGAESDFLRRLLGGKPVKVLDALVDDGKYESIDGRTVEGDGRYFAVISGENTPYNIASGIYQPEDTFGYVLRGNRDEVTRTMDSVRSVLLVFEATPALEQYALVPRNGTLNLDPKKQAPFSLVTHMFVANPFYEREIRKAIADHPHNEPLFVEYMSPATDPRLIGFDGTSQELHAGTMEAGVSRLAAITAVRQMVERYFS